MFIFLTFFIAVMVVGAQALWKSAIMHSSFDPKISYLVSLDMLRFLFSLKVMTGFFFYALGSLLYFAALKSYDYNKVQLVVVPASLVLSVLVASMLFNEHLKIVNIIGLVVLLLGVSLVVWK